MDLGDTYRAICALLTPDERRRMAWLIGAFFVSGVFETAGVASIGPFMAVITNPEGAQHGRLLGYVYQSFSPASQTEFVTIVGILVLLFLVVSNSISALVVWKTASFLFGQQHRLSERLLRRYLSQPYSFFLQRNSSDLIKNIFLTVNMVVGSMLMPAAQALSRAIVALLILIFLVVLDPILALSVGGMAAGLYVFIYTRVQRRLHDSGHALTEADRQRNKMASEALNGIREVMLFNSREWFVRQFARPSRDYARNATLDAVIGGLPRYALEVVAFGTLIFVVLYAFRVHGNAHETLTLISLYAFAALRLMPAMQAVFQGVSRVRFNMPALSLLLEEFRIPQGHVVGEEREALPITMSVGLEIDGLTFGYTEDSPVLKDVRLEIPAGSAVGIVGSSGAGKTTFVDILLGLLPLQTGRILVDGKELGVEDFYRWRMSIGYVSQQMYLLDGTIAENIAFGVAPESIDMAAVRRAAAQAHLEDFIAGLPDGYETVVGERGVRISGGQRQRIAIARALYRDPPILVFDEATNALDNVTEAKITEAIHELSKSKTVIMIAHRLSTIRECSRIFVFHHGKVAGAGTYDELLADNAIFRELVDAGRREGVIA